PPPREDAAMAYDPARHRLLLFGGVDNNASPLDDTWSWDGTNWTQETPTASPPALYMQGMAPFDKGGSTVLFGGFGFNPAAGPGSSETWIWNGIGIEQPVPESPSVAALALLGLGLAFTSLWF